MRVLIAPDSFTGTLSASEAARAIADGWASVSPADELDLCPISDGGPGFVDALHLATGGDLVAAVVTGPTGEPVPATFLLSGTTAAIECATACGLHLIPTPARDPLATSTRGVGELIGAAVGAGARRIVVGVGGTSTVDGGAGLLAALGATAIDASGGDATPILSDGGGGLALIQHVDISAAREALEGIDVIVATDVDVPLLGPRGSAAGFGPQKGADDDAIAALETSLGLFADAVGRRPDGASPAVALGAGAGGGIGFALLALGARRVPGIETVLERIRLSERARGCGLVVTGEGRFDWQSLAGKAVGGVAAAAAASGVPTVMIAGEVMVGRREWSAAGLAGAYSMSEALGGERSRERPAESLAALAALVARSWSR